MNETEIDQIDRVDAAFAGNLLLSTLPKQERALLEPAGTLVAVEAGQIIQRNGSQVDSTLFPFETTMISLVVDVDKGRSVEVASIGHEGAVGGIVSCGHAPAYARAQVLVPGPALKLPMTALEEAKLRSGHVRNLFCRFSDYLLAQVMQSSACRICHTIEQRAAAWLLAAQDRAGDSIELTQEAFAGLLGVQRTTVNAAVKSLQAQGLIATRRGSIRVIDRDGLKRTTCGCYEALDRHFEEVIGSSGSGGDTDSPGCD